MNWTRIEDLIEEVGLESFQEVLEIFIEESDEIADRLLLRSHRETLLDDLHFLKGAALNLGFDELAKACQAADRNARQNEAMDETLIVGIHADYHLSKQQLLSGLASARRVA